ncbi:MAG: hypothetical protein KGL11_05105 [Alphaproteobacteria bacterium]|nr:hypothetical protein [Alphaproteobacteria bacterium]
MLERRTSNVVMLPRRRARRPIAALLRPARRREPRAPDDAFRIESTISDYELQAFVDDALDAARRERVRSFLARHPAAAADAAAYRHQNRVLRQLVREPPSPAVTYLAAQFARRLAQQRGRHILAWSAAAAVATATAWSVAAGGDWTVVPHVFLTAGR